MKQTASFLLAAAITASVAAQQESDTDNVITVTADYRDSALENTTTSVSVMTDDELKQAAEQHLEEVINLFPNLNWAGGSSRPKFFQIRGIGNTAVGSTADSGVSVHMNDIPLESHRLYAVEFFDVDGEIAEELPCFRSGYSQSIGSLVASRPVWL